MSRIIIKSIQFIQPGHPYHEKEADWLIEDGKIIRISSEIKEDADTEIDGKNTFMSPGWLDLRAQFCDPGEEYKEDFSSGTAAASRGGFTSVAVLPTHTENRDHKAAISYVVSQSGINGVGLLPYGTMSKATEGKSLTEMYDLSSSGAVAFTDDLHPTSSGMLRKALLYAKDMDAVVTVIPFDHELVPGGQMHEGIISTKNGLRAWPDITETLRIERDLNILRYTGGKLHFSLISSEKGVQLIRNAKKEGLHVTCDVAAHHLCYTEEQLKSFNSLYKVCPPLRSDSDRQALVEAVKDGTVDIVCSDHQPQDVENKEKEFEHASFGIAGIQSVFNHLLEAGIPVQRIVEVLSIQPRILLDHKLKCTEGSKAELTLFTDRTTTELKNNHPSKSPYNPATGKKLKGKIIGTIYKNHSFFEA